MFKNMNFVMLTGAVMAVFFSPIYIQAEETPSPKQECVKKEMKKKKKGCPCGK